MCDGKKKEFRSFKNGMQGKNRLASSTITPPTLHEQGSDRSVPAVELAQ